MAVRTRARAKAAEEYKEQVVLAHHIRCYNQAKRWEPSYNLAAAKKRNAKTEAERRAKKIRLHGRREADIFLETCFEQSQPPTEEIDPQNVCFAPAQLLCEDSVRVEVQVDEFVHQDPASYPFADDSELTLRLQVFMTPSSRFTDQASQSPTFILDTWFGVTGSDEAPFWADHLSLTGPASYFWISRAKAVDLVNLAACLTWNAGNKEDLLEWCKMATRGSAADTRAQHILYPPPAPEPPVYPLKATEVRRAIRRPLNDTLNTL